MLCGYEARAVWADLRRLIRQLAERLRRAPRKPMVEESARP